MYQLVSYFQISVTDQYMHLTIIYYKQFHCKKKNFEKEEKLIDWVLYKKA